MPLNSCSWPIGMLIATQFSESCSCIADSALKKSARSRSSMFTKTTRARCCSSQRFHSFAVDTSTPMTPDRANTAPSTTRRAPSASATKLGSPGASIRLILRPFHSQWASAPLMDMPRRFSSSSKSATVVPSVTLPRRLIAPDWKSRASVSDVFPVPRWPSTATLRILSGAWDIGTSCSG